MKDEIKKILDGLEKISTPTGISYSGDVTINNDDVKILKDYITNLQEKYDKALELLVDFNLPCENDDFNTTAGLDYCSKYCCVDEEQYKKCWNEFIEWRLKDE